MPINYNIDLNNDIHNNINKHKVKKSRMQNNIIQEYYCNSFSNLYTYKHLYNISINDPCKFWNTQIEPIYWQTKPTNSFDYNNNKWCPGGKSNLCYNCVDRHAISTPSKTAIVWYGDDPKDRVEITYLQLLNLVQNIANLLIQKGIKKGDTVCLYMPNHYLSVAAMLACARIGAVHMVVFSGFSSEVLKNRIIESKAKVILTMEKCSRGGKTIELLKPVQEVCESIKNNNFSNSINTGNIKQYNTNENNPVNNKSNTNKSEINVPSVIVLDEDTVSYKQLVKEVPIEWLNNEDEGFILYTSGTSGKSKGVVHAALPYMLYVSSTFKNIFACNKDDVSFCTSDIGWITGHSYTVYAPLFWGLKIVLFEGTPMYPNPDRYWEIIDKEKVSIFYTAPTAIRSLQACNIQYVNKYKLSSLRILGSVGEPLNESAWQWYFENIGKKKLPIMDTWWQTETGGIILAPIRNTKEQIPGVAGFPFFGVKVEIDSKDNQLVITNNYPGKYKYILDSITTDKISNTQHMQNAKNNIKITSNEKYYTGDGAQYITINNNNNKEYRAIKISGRVDDVINISGHRLSTTEFENAISKMEEIKETATIAIEHELTGQAAVVFVVLKNNKPEQNNKVDIKVLHSNEQTQNNNSNINILPNKAQTRDNKNNMKILQSKEQKQSNIKENKNILEDNNQTNASNTNVDKNTNTIKQIKKAQIEHSINKLNNNINLSNNENPKSYKEEPNLSINIDLYKQNLDSKIIKNIRKAIGAIAKPYKIIYLKELPKTTTGKIERYKLRKLAQEDI